MNLEYISSLRATNQQISGSNLKTAKEVASCLIAVQAQDYNMSKWALGIRFQNSTEKCINNEIDSGDIIRTHLLGPTWHFVSSNDVYWLLELSAPQIKASLKYRDKQLGLSETVFRKCNSVIERKLKNGNHLTRDELIVELLKSKSILNKNQASHIFIRAEVEGIICSGKQKEGKPTYAILEEWVPERNRKVNRDEALKELGQRYFTSRGPATIQDFIWWSGLSSGDAKLALEYNKTHLISETIENETYWFDNSSIGPNRSQDETFLLPAFDEFIIGYRDRKASLSKTDHKKTISDNGIFYPTILLNGQIIGTWRRNNKKDAVIVSARLFKTDFKKQDQLFKKSIAEYSRFINKKIELIPAKG